MEPQPEMTNSPEQNRSELPKESLRSMLASPHYWLAALLPALAIIASSLILSIIGWTTLALPLILFLSTAFGFVICFVVNSFYPFVTDIRRAIYSDLPALILSIILMVVILIPAWLYGGSDSFFMLFPSTCGFILILNSLLVFFGWLGAKAGIALGRNA